MLKIELNISIPSQDILFKVTESDRKCVSEKIDDEIYMISY